MNELEESNHTDEVGKCIAMLYHATSSKHTENYRYSEIIKALKVFFSEDVIEEACIYTADDSQNLNITKSETRYIAYNGRISEFNDKELDNWNPIETAYSYENVGKTIILINSEGSIAKGTVLSGSIMTSQTDSTHWIPIPSK